MFLSHYSLFIEYLERVNKLGIITIRDLSVLDFIHYFFISRIKSLKNRLSDIPISPVIVMLITEMIIVQITGLYRIGNNLKAKKRRISAPLKGK
jgi:hypothetical protein